MFELRVEEKVIAYWMMDRGWRTSIGGSDLGWFIRRIIGDGGWNEERIPNPSPEDLSVMISRYLRKEVAIWKIEWRKEEGWVDIN